MMRGKRVKELCSDFVRVEGIFSMENLDFLIRALDKSEDERYEALSYIYVREINGELIGEARDRHRLHRIGKLGSNLWKHITPGVYGVVEVKKREARLGRLPDEYVSKFIVPDTDSAFPKGDPVCEIEYAGFSKTDTTQSSINLIRFVRELPVMVDVTFLQDLGSKQWKCKCYGRGMPLVFEAGDMLALVASIREKG